MRTVTTLPRGRPLTRADLDAMPDDGHRYELIDGTLVVTPAPSYGPRPATFRRRRCWPSRSARPVRGGST
ncbi:MAG: hypothetical protein ACRDO8_10600 [Nocardioidaceae bacterium]